MYRSKRSYVQVGFPQDAETQEKDYVENQNGVVFTQTTRGVKGTNPLIMSQTSQNLNRLRFARASVAGLPSQKGGSKFDHGRNTMLAASNFGVSGNKLASGQGVTSTQALSRFKDPSTQDGMKELQNLSNLTSNINSVSQIEEGMSPAQIYDMALNQNRNAFKNRSRLIHSQEQKYRLQKQGLARKSVGGGFQMDHSSYVTAVDGARGQL